MKKPPSNFQKGQGPNLSLQALPSDSADKSSERQKKARPSLNKRVSFGGNSINVFYKQSEFSPQDNEPALKIPRTHSRPSPSPQRSPRFSRPDARILPTTEESASEDTLSMPSAPEMHDDSYFPDHDPSPPTNENPSPIAAGRESIGFHDRQSFGLFVDEDVTMGERNIVSDDHDDMTIDFPRLSSAPRARRISTSSVLSDGDITQQIYGFIPKILDEEGFDDNQDSTDDFQKQVTPPLQPPADVTADDAEAATSGGAMREISQLAVPQVPGDSPAKEVSMDMDKEVHPSSGSVRSGVEPSPQAQQSAMPKSTQLASISPVVEEPNEPEVYPSPTGAVRVRQVPPNRRKLFDGDENEDDDTTLHYHDEAPPTTDVPSSIQRKPLRVLSGVPSTPLSAIQSKLRSVIEERPSASGKRNAASTLRELSSSASRPSEPNVDRSDTETNRGVNFSFRDFLQAVQLNFDRKAETRQRGQSLAPQNFEKDSFPRPSLEGIVYESVRKASVLETFSHQIAVLQGKIAQSKEGTNVNEGQLESSQAPIFRRMAEVESMAIHEITMYRVNMKRLRKLYTLDNKDEWVTGRQVWEKNLIGKLSAASAALSQDSVTLGDSLEEHRVANALFVEQVAGLGLGGAFNNDRSSKEFTEEDIKKQRAFIQEMSMLRDRRCFVDSLKQERHDLRTRKEATAPRKNSLTRTCFEMRKKTNANSEKGTRKRIIEQMELNSIVSGVMGVNLVRVNKNNISLRVLDIMDIQFSLHDEKVINISCKTVAASNKASCPVWRPYMDGCISLVNWRGGIKSAKFVSDIPRALFDCTSALRQARLVYEDAVLFLDKNMGRIITGGLRQDEEYPVLYLTMEASFYSLTLRSKFDIVVTVTTHLPAEESSSLKQDVALEKVQRYFGHRPDDEHISSALLESGLRGDGMYSLSGGFCGVSALLR